MTDKLFAYYRVSTKDQADKGTEENQEQSINDFLTGKDVNVVCTFFDPLSGADNDRPQYKEMMSRLHEVAGICVYDPDRLSRDFETGLKFMFDLKHQGKKLYVSRTGTITDFSKDEDQLIHAIKAWVSEQERKKIKARQADGIKRYIAKEKRWGPRRKEVNWKHYDEYRGYGISHASIAKMMDMSPATLWRRIKSRK